MTGRRFDEADRAPLLQWMIFTGLTVFGAFLLWRFGLIRQMVMADRTYISSLIVLLYVGTALHCLSRMIVIGREAEAAHGAAEALRRGVSLAAVGDRIGAAGASPLPEGIITAHLRDLLLRSAGEAGRTFDPTLLLRRLAGRLRGTNQFGAFVGDTLMKLGLVGTIVGFIMMLAPIGAIDMANRGTVQSALSLMSGGMAVAMYTTLAGLVGSILIRIQYYMLESATAGLFSLAVGLTEAQLVAAPLRFMDAPQ